MRGTRRKRPKEVFLSHSSHDHKFAVAMSEVLRSHGVPVWFSPTNVLGAQAWHDEIGKALARCDWFALILSPHSVQSKWVKQELIYALNQPRYENRIVPIHFRECNVTKLSWTLHAFQEVDFTSGREGGFESLLRIWGIEYKPEKW